MGYTSQQFIQKANTIHNNKYNYSKINYQNIKAKIEIICPKHGNFWQLPYDHLRGKGCPKCGRESLKKQKQNNDKKINFEILTKDIKNRDTIIEIKCPNCNQIFKKTYWNFQRSKNCPFKRDYCRNNNIKEIEIPYTDLRNIYKILTEHFS